MYRTLRCLYLLLLMFEMNEYSLVVADNGMFGYQATGPEDHVLGRCPKSGYCSSSEQSCSCDRKTCPFYHNCCPLLEYGLPRIPDIWFGSDDVAVNAAAAVPNASTTITHHQAPRIDIYGESACVSIIFNHGLGITVVMVIGCPSYSEADVDSRCRSTTGEDRSIVVGSTSGALFRNADCAACNGDTSVTQWSGTSDCEQDVDVNSVPQIRLNCSRADLNDQPDSLRLANCDPDLISSCPVDWNDEEVVQRCAERSGLTLFVYGPSTTETNPAARVFRNHFCATCHGVVDYACLLLPYLVPMNELVNFMQPIDLVPFNLPTTCEWTVVNRSELTIRDDGNATLADHPEVVYAPDVFRVFDEFAEVCIAHEVSLQRVPQDRSVDYMIQTWATVSLVAVSLLLLFVLFVVYLVFPSLRNTPGRCVICLVVSLFVGQLLYLFVDLKYAGETFCFVQSVLVHYCFLAAFAWMNVMSYDVFRTFSGMSVAPSASSQSGLISSHRFTFYSIYAWSFPGLIVLVSVLADTALKDVTGFWRSHYGERLCWLRSGFPLLLYFGVPVGILLVNNVGLFIGSAVHIYRASAASRMAHRSSNHIQLLILYVKLFFVMGVAWLFGFFATLTDWAALWYLHVVFSSLQGAIISLSFLVTKQVRRLLRDAFSPRRGSKHLGRTLTTGVSSSSGRQKSTKRVTAL